MATAEKREILQDSYSVDQRIADAQCGFGVVLGDVVNGLRQIGDGLRGK